MHNSSVIIISNTFFHSTRRPRSDRTGEPDCATLLKTVGEDEAKSNRDLIARAKSLRRRPNRNKKRNGSALDSKSPLEKHHKEVLEKQLSEEKSDSYNLDDTLELARGPFSIRYNRDKLRTFAENIPEVHFIGEICHGEGFSGCSISCKWSISWGRTWSLLAGIGNGQSQYATTSDENLNIWNHPIDLHFTTANAKGRPRIMLQVWNLDSYGRTNLIGYGFTYLPSTPGTFLFKISSQKVSKPSINRTRNCNS